MISYECKNCGGELTELEPGIGRCLFCHCKQPIPRIMDEQFNRANRLRIENGNFDESKMIYEEILKNNPDEAEAYWGIVLCRYGIEYVKDFRTGDYMPTCNRVAETPIAEDSDFKMAVSKAMDKERREYYCQQAEMIDSIMRDIMAIVKNESPYDIFISFKDRDDNTKVETKDSRKAMEIYYALAQKGYKVFFSKITLKGKAGEKYEPYIYSALKTAKIMILVGTRPEYLNARWVKNEWSRFNKMRLGGENKLLLPVYEEMDAYEMPFELQGLQALNMGELDFLESLKHNIESFLGENFINKYEEFQQGIERSSKIQARKWNDVGEKFLQHRKYNEAMDNFLKAIETDPECSRAYWNKMLLNLKCTKEDLLSSDTDLRQNNDFLMACEYATEKEKEEYEEVVRACDRNWNLNCEYQSECNKVVQNYMNEKYLNPRLLDDRKLLENEIDGIRMDITKMREKQSGMAMFSLIFGNAMTLLLAAFTGLLSFSEIVAAEDKSYYIVGYAMFIIQKMIFDMIMFCIVKKKKVMVLIGISPVFIYILWGIYIYCTKDTRTTMIYFMVTDFPTIISVVFDLYFLYRTIQCLVYDKKIKNAYRNINNLRTEHSTVMKSITSDLEYELRKLHGKYQTETGKYKIKHADISLYYEYEAQLKRNYGA